MTKPDLSEHEEIMDRAVKRLIASIEDCASQVPQHMRLEWYAAQREMQRRLYQYCVARVNELEKHDDKA